MFKINNNLIWCKIMPQWFFLLEYVVSRDALRPTTFEEKPLPPNNIYYYPWRESLK